MTSVTELSSLDDLLDHARSSRWRGELSEATHHSRCRNPTCGDEVSLALFIQDGIICDARFTGKGCFVSQASASLLCQRLIGQQLEPALSLTVEGLLGLNPSKFSLGRQHCFLLGVEAFQKLMTGWHC